MLVMLFPGDWTRSNVLAEPVLATPLGNLTLDFSLNGCSLISHQEGTFQMSGGRVVLTFETAAAQAALLISAVHPRLPEGMRIGGARGGGSWQSK